MNEANTLKQLGWRDFFAAQVTSDPAHLIVARVVRQDVNRYHLATARGPASGVLRGRTRQAASSRADLPTVGDWVLCAPADAADPETLVIERRLERFSKFSRKEAGDRFDEQVVAANIDTVFIVTGLDDNFSPARIERYLLLAWDSGATPVIVLSKTDLCIDIDSRLETVLAVAMGTPVYPVNALSGEGLDALRQYVRDGETIALLGSSGVGKSTIINRLLGYDRFRTGEVRDGDSKGRHTTTFRELCEVPGGGMLIDTPGMREIQIWADSDLLAGTFDDIETLAARCRFNDCRHESEPGCAVAEAISEGKLDAARLDSYRKFLRELAHFEAKQDAGARAQKHAENRRFSKMVKNLPNKRDRES